MRPVLVALAAMSIASAEGLLTDSDFESAAGWRVPAGSGWSVPDDDGHSGSHCLRYHAAEPARPPLIEQVVDCLPNTDYVVTAAFKSDGTLRPVVQVAAPGLPDERVVELTAGAEPGRWEVVSKRFNSGVARRLVVRIAPTSDGLRGGAVPAGVAAIDDVQIWPAAEAPAGLAVAGGFMARPPGENIALGAAYELSPPPNYAYSTDPDDRIQLTDGVYSVGYFWVQKSTVGWSRGRPIRITIDLGREQPITGLSFNTAAGVAGVSWPASIAIYVSDDREAWWYAGDLVNLSLAKGRPPAEGYAVHRFWTDSLAARGRYVALLITPGGPYCFCDEIEVYRGPDALLTAAREGEAVTDLTAHYRRQTAVNTLQSRVLADLLVVRDELERTRLPEAERRRLAARLENAAATAGQFVDDPAARPRLTAPYNAAHETVFAVAGALAASLGRPTLSAWPAVPFDPVEPTTAPPTEAGALDLTLMRGEIRSAALNLASAGEQAGEVTVVLADVPGAPAPDWLDLREVVYTATSAGPTTASALPPAVRTDGGWRVTLPAGLTRQLWLNVDGGRLPAGRYDGAVVLAAPGTDPLRVPFRLRVSALEMPAELSLSLGGWDYTDGPHRGVTTGNRDQVIAFLREYHVDSPWATGAVMPFGQHDAEGVMTVPPDTSRMTDWLSRWPGARHYCVFNAFGAPLADTPAARRRVQDWINFWVGVLAEYGIEPRQLNLLLYDEPHSEAGDRVIISYARAIREVQPEVVIFNDPTWADPRRATPELFELSGVLCPNRPMWLGNPEVFAEFYTAQQRAGRRLAFYSCSGPVRSLDPYSYHRLQAWDCFRWGMGAMYFWAFSDHGGASAWNELIAPGVCYSPQFLDDEGCVTSKHMEAIRQGLFDHQYLTMLREAVTRAKAAGRADPAVARGEALLTDGVARVLADRNPSGLSWNIPKDRSVADTVRVEVLDVLEALASRN